MLKPSRRTEARWAPQLQHALRGHFLRKLKPSFLLARMMGTPEFLCLMSPQNKPQSRENDITSPCQGLAAVSQSPSWDPRTQQPCPPQICHLMLLQSSWQIPTHLGLSNHGGLSVTQRRKWQPQLSFSVTLEKQKVTVNKRTG